MIEPALYFILGFLSSGLMALMIAPAIWARAVRLTRRRIEASQPLTLAEIRADRDQLRAEFAVTARRLELNIADLRTKGANQRIALGRAEGERDAAIGERLRLATDLKVYERELSVRGEGLTQLQTELRSAEADLAQRNHLVNGLELRIRELNSEIDSSKLEIAALNARLEAAGSQADSLDLARQRADERIASLTHEIERRGGVIAEERNRAERLLGELANLKKISRLPMPQSASLSQLPVERDDNERPAINRLEAENLALETRLRALAEERDRLSFDLQATKVRDLAMPADAGDIALLKDRLGTLAAEIAHMAAERDGPEGPVDKLVANALPVDAAQTGTGLDLASSNTSLKRPDTLAEKIQALRQTAAGDQS